ncbi:MAG: hypothetical protein IPP14_14825 [Planctomycetes bacterium]|nr:hypothetical protein [Planctomycetota bacterium]
MNVLGPATALRVVPRVESAVLVAARLPVNVLAPRLLSDSRVAVRLTLSARLIAGAVERALLLLLLERVVRSGSTVGTPEAVRGTVPSER